MGEYVKSNINENIDFLNNIFKDCQDIVKRKINIGTNNDVEVYLLYIDMMVDRELLDKNILEPLMFRLDMCKITPFKEDLVLENIFKVLKNSFIQTIDIQETNDFDVIVDAVLSGDTPLFIDGFKKAIIISSKGFMSRGVPECTTEVVVQGSKEAFSEVFRINSMLLRRRIRDSNLKIKQLRVGKRSKTDVGIMYIENIVRPDILDEVINRINNINIDALLDSSYVEQFIEDSKLSPFPTVQVTERPDKASSALLEGRICIIVDNSPFVLLVPSTFNVFFQSSEDYYQRFEIMSFIRSIRFLAGFLAVTLEGLYLCIALYHPSMINLDILLKMSSARESVPFPGLVEILLMDFSFELLREGSIRLPSPVSGTIGIVGGLIIGQSAINASLVSPIVVIIVALASICSFSIPNNQLVSSFRLTKYLIIFASAFLGFYGFCITIIFFAIHLCSLESFFIPYLYPFVSGEINNYSDFKDTLFRMPLSKMNKRPIFANPKEKVRGDKNDREQK